MKRNLIVVIFFSIVILCVGCGGGGDQETGSWIMPQPHQTGIDPELGTYLITRNFSNDVMTAKELEVTKVGNKKYVHLAHQYYQPPAEVINGGFSIQVGDIGPGLGDYPREGYAISGWFESKTKISGMIKLAVYGVITLTSPPDARDRDVFVANLVKSQPVN
ncbi:MAG: hypothetical protein WCV58_00810 [Patescibacteria group bacterium]|jgi:hypothetical protein